MDGEETLLAKQTRKGAEWDTLSPEVRQRFNNSPAVWLRKALEYSLRHQVAWESSLVKDSVPEKRYYQEMLKVSRQYLMLYPYHVGFALADILQATPFKYYTELMVDVIQNQKSYDTVPNFTAADCVRLLGIGRNQYIDLMNQIKVKSGWTSFFSGGKRQNPRNFLPTEVIPEFALEYWWLPRIAFVSVEAVENSSRAEHAIIDLLIKQKDYETSKRITCGQLPRDVLHSLYRRGLVFIDVPVEDEDQIILPPLANFVMNRVLGDYLESLLYQIFVSIDERTTIQQLATVLQLERQVVKTAVSLLCRLGFATKKSLSSASAVIHRSWENYVPAFGEKRILEGSSSLGAAASPREGTLHDPSRHSTTASSHSSALHSTSSSSLSSSSVISSLASHSAEKRIAFVFDSKLAAFLMMGNLGSGLKSHAVTLFERGKMAEEDLAPFLTELEKVQEVDEDEGEAIRYFRHAITLRQTLRALRTHGPVDMIRCESMDTLDPSTRARLLQKNYKLLISMAPLSLSGNGEHQILSSASPPHFGPPIAETTSAWFKLFVYHSSGYGPDAVFFPRGCRVTSLPATLSQHERLLVHKWGAEPAETSASLILTELNDALRVGPVLLHAYSDDVIDVPFPLVSCELSSPSPSLTLSSPSPGHSTTRSASELSSHPCLVWLNEHLHLSGSVGYVRFIRLSTTGAWVPIDIQYGVPLFDAELNVHVTNSLSLRKLFDPENLTLHSKSMRRVCLAMLRFMEEQQGESLPSTVSPEAEGEVAYPNTTFIFEQGKLSRCASLAGVSQS